MSDSHQGDESESVVVDILSRRLHRINLSDRIWMAMASGIVLSVFAVFCAIDEKFGVQSELRPSDIPGTVSIAQFHPLRAAIFFAAAGTIIVIAAVALYLLVSHRDRQGESASFAKVLIVQMGLVGALMLPIF